MIGLKDGLKNQGQQGLTCSKMHKIWASLYLQDKTAEKGVTSGEGVRKKGQNQQTDEDSLSLGWGWGSARQAINLH